MTRNTIGSIAVCMLALAVAGCGGGGESSGTNINDNERPSDVIGFAAAPINAGLTLSWTPATDNIAVASYRITLLSNATVRTATASPFTWTGLNNGTAYNFSIVAVDTAGNTSLTPTLVTGTPQLPDTTPPTDVSNLNGIGGYNNPVTMNYVQLSLSWTASGSVDLAYYILYISSNGGTTWNILNEPNNPPVATDPAAIGTINSIIVPGNGSAANPVTAAELTPTTNTFAIGTTYTIKIVSVDTSGNLSTGVIVTVIPTLSVDITPPQPVGNLSSAPGNQRVTLTWTPPVDTDVAGYRIYYRKPVDDQVTAWTLAGSGAATSFAVTGLANGATYEFMVAAYDLSGNQTAGAATALRIDDNATKTTAIPTSDAIMITPNIRGGVFRTGFFSGAGQPIVVTVSTASAGLLNLANTHLYYTLDGSDVNTSLTIPTRTAGYIPFDSSVVPVTTITGGALYSMTIDFDPATGGIQNISQNLLRPDGLTPDHIVLKMIVVGLTDASRVFKETYLIYNVPQFDYLKFSGMTTIRRGATATYVKAGNTAGDMIFIGGENFGGVLTSAERYRIAFEHFEGMLGGSAMAAGRTDHRATLLNDGSSILVTGGYDPDMLNAPANGLGNETMGLKSYARFSAQSANDDFVQTGAALQQSRRFQSATRLYDGSVLVLGGLNGEQQLEGATLAAPRAQQDENPTKTNLGLNTLAAIADASAIVGQTIEIVDAVPGTMVEQRGVVTAANYDTELSRWNLTIDGLVTDMILGTRFRFINTATATAELFNATGTATAPVADTMQYPRYGHSATLLQDGTVFIAGGLYDYKNDTNDDFEFTTGIFNPQSALFETLGFVARLTSTRFFHSAVLLKDGKVLIMGGLSRGDNVFKSSGFMGAGILSTAEIFDPFTRSVRSVGGMTKGRIFPSATLLPSGKVLVCGGYVGVTSDGILVYDSSAEIYDPGSGNFTSTGLMLTPRGECSAGLVELSTSPIYGQVVVGGGTDNTLAELYNESTGLFSATAHGVSGDRLIGAAGTPLKDGTVLITGGQTDDYFNGNSLVAGLYLASAETYDTSLVKFVRTSGDMSNGRRHHTATLLQNGKVLVAGGENDQGGLAKAEIYDPQTRVFNPTADMLQKRYKHTATVLPDGRVFIAGGANLTQSLATCEIYNPTTGIFNSATTMAVGRYDHTATLLPGGRVLIAGGEGIDSASIEIFNGATDTFIAPDPLRFLLAGRDGHSALAPVYAMGRAHFTNTSTAVTGSNGAQGLAVTAWNSSNVKVGDMIMSVADGVPYTIAAIGGAQAITLAGAYTGVSTATRVTGGAAPTDGFEDYLIISQDVYITGGVVTDPSTEVFTTSDLLTHAGVSMADGRVGNTMTPFGDMRILVTGGRYLITGTYSNSNADGSFTDDTWVLRTLHPAFELIFHSAFRLANDNAIVVSGHSAQAFLSN
ncbi:MAG: kelch repeat-containing protein [Planctomycetota bacterium]